MKKEAHRLPWSVLQNSTVTPGALASVALILWPAAFSALTGMQRIHPSLCVSESPARAAFVLKICLPLQGVPPDFPVAVTRGWR